MAFPASTITKKQAWETLTGHANAIKGKVQELRDASAAGDTNRFRYVDLQKQIDIVIGLWTTAAAVPNLEEYARDQVDDNTLDLPAEYTAMRTAAIALRLWLFNNIPTSGGGVVLYSTGLDGLKTPLSFTTAATAGFRTEADTFTASIS